MFGRFVDVGMTLEKMVSRRWVPGMPGVADHRASTSRAHNSFCGYSSSTAATRHAESAFIFVAVDTVPPTSRSREVAANLEADVRDAAFLRSEG